ncbi:D-alanine--D-alanine ligase family protein [Haliovirga abyssi]|uniref:D-alanine--D-alanine ligase n=1 Tax=Haliovirga abyssi TaxID=2996794 RepID=A0AAU9D0V9_9FUSO|nr:D-alanine--D-alanine ligase [Haliovirga abyssi]BDU49601.1 D-alanine--D-alanine ligase [Haliovirga abyssi]
MRIAVLMGGISAEREISLKTGRAVLKKLLELGYDAFEVNLTKENIVSELTRDDYDIAFIALHGEFGEDGRVQAFLDIVGKKYTGSGFIASAISIDKEITKKIIKNIGICIPKSYMNIEEVKKFPVIVKPAFEGSSIGLHICKNRDELEKAVNNLKSKKILIEEFIEGEELTIGVLNREGLGVVKIKPKSGVYDYKSKYTKGETEFEVPAKIKKEIYDKAVLYSEIIYKELELKGAIRVDMILSEDKLYFLEVNTIPGMTETSLLPKLANLKGYSFGDLLKKIIEPIAKN